MEWHKKKRETGVPSLILKTEMNANGQTTQTASEIRKKLISEPAFGFRSLDICQDCFVTLQDEAEEISRPKWEKTNQPYHIWEAINNGSPGSEKPPMPKSGRILMAQAVGIAAEVMHKADLSKNRLLSMTEVSEPLPPP